MPLMKDSPMRIVKRGAAEGAALGESPEKKNAKTEEEEAHDPKNMTPSRLEAEMDADIAPLPGDGGKDGGNGGGGGGGFFKFLLSLFPLKLSQVFGRIRATSVFGGRVRICLLFVICFLFSFTL